MEIKSVNLKVLDSKGKEVEIEVSVEEARKMLGELKVFFGDSKYSSYPYWIYYPIVVNPTPSPTYPNYYTVTCNSEHVITGYSYTA